MDFVSSLSKISYPFLSMNTSCICNITDFHIRSLAGYLWMILWRQRNNTLHCLWYLDRLKNDLRLMVASRPEILLFSHPHPLPPSHRPTLPLKSLNANLSTSQMLHHIIQPFFLIRRGGNQYQIRTEG